MPVGAAGRMPTSDQARHHNPLKAWTEVPDQLYTAGRARELPGGEAVWCAATRHWWEAVRTMPHCQLWSESDWCFAETTALLHQAVWTGDDPGKAAELGRRERFLGMTREARDGMRVRYVPAEQPQQPTLVAVPAIGPAGRQRPRPIDPGPAQ